MAESEDDQELSFRSPDGVCQGYVSEEGRVFWWICGLGCCSSEGGRVGPHCDWVKGRWRGCKLSCPSIVPVVVSGQYFDVALSEMVVGVRCMLHYRWFVDTWRCLGSGEMLLISGCGRATRFPDIIMITGTIVTACACVVVDYYLGNIFGDTFNER